ncbi:MAG: TrbI/VirB10 family protein [Rickettsiales bacterium]|nr:TrbI/VirB10 family protein [Rickettsiales bacterium]
MSDEEQKPPPPDGSGGYEEEGYSPEAQPPEEGAFGDNSGPAVASSANKNMILMVIGGLLGLFILYQVFSGDDEVSVPIPPQTGASLDGAAVAAATDIPMPAAPIMAPPLPPPPPLMQEEALPELPPPPATPVIDFMGGDLANEELQQRRASEMLIINNLPDGTKGEDEVDGKSQAERAVATHVGDLENLVLQGKIIDAVLETALDTTLEGPLRALVTRDVYAESGYTVLIPKGSRIIGTYNADTVRGQGRVFVIWSRLIRPDGVDIQLNSQTIDRLGRSGMAGHVDDRYFEIFGGAVLTSILGITLAGISDAILDPPETSTTQSTDGATTESTNAVTTAITEGVATIGAVSKQVVGGLLDARPSITVDQGTPLKVYVNRDLEFPGEAARGVRIIQ